MGRQGSENGGTQRGFTLIEVMLVVATVGLLAAVDLYTALMRYHADHGGFPPEGSFDLHTLSPVSDLGYFSSAESFTRKMQGDELLAYATLDVSGPASEMVSGFRAKADSDILVLMLHTSVTGEWLDGVYLNVDGDLERIDGS